MTRTTIVLGTVVATATTAGLLILALPVHDRAPRPPSPQAGAVERSHRDTRTSRTPTHAATPGPQIPAPQPPAPEPGAPPKPPTHPALAGRVIGPHDAPVRGALVTLAADRSTTAAWSVEGDVEQTTTTGEDGRFELRSVSASRRHVLRVERDGFASRSIATTTATRSPGAELEIRLDRGGTLLGRVLDGEGRPLRGVDVVVLDPARRSDDPERSVEDAALSDADGEYRVDHLRAGLKRVTVMASGFATVTQELVRVAAGEETELADFVLQSGARIVGRTVDALDGSPLEGVQVRARAVGRDNRARVVDSHLPVRSDADGRFRCEGLTAGAHRLTFRLQGFATLDSTHSTGGDAADDDGDDEVAAKLTRLPSVRGRVVDAATGEPVEAFTLVPSASERLPFGSAAAGTERRDPRGRFEYVAPQRRGDFHLLARAAGYSTGCSGSINLESGGDVDGVVIRMHRGVRVRGRVTDARGEVLSGATVRLSPGLGEEANESADLLLLALSRAARVVQRDERVTRSDAEGRFELHNVREGRHTMLVEHPDFVTRETVETVVAPRGADVRLPDVKLIEGGALEGVVVDEDGDPLKGARVEILRQGALAGSGLHGATTGADGRFELAHLRPGRYGLRIAAARDSTDGQGGFDLIERVLARDVSDELTLADGEVLELRLVR